MREGDTEYDVAQRYAAARAVHAPLIGETLPYMPHRSTCASRSATTPSRAGRAGRSGRLAGADEVTVCFADIVGFTQLGETLEPSSSATVTGRLVELAADGGRARRCAW